ncbi:VOC family protein [Bradyrhizobium sp. NP1]|uniref:VOC family protein n=1 Tax=Bradyrhizobium sp. NP1 TaxID=3049772 RepID=UPI0025A6207D|nr:VOC family protein [Bradyrhizobium sp. NP1]WJR80995.1 VOC family protein [Bradyrhizobium sp. NP1]
MFDHAVLNLHYHLDAGEELFGSLGFKISPRGYHSLGSMNHLIVFGTNYLELIGLDPANPNPRKELLDWPVGLNGLVYSSDDIEVTQARLQSQQLPALEPKAFSRPVTIDGETAEARFRTIHMDREFFPASRLYFCEHLTPGLVWNGAFMQHPNTANCLKRVLVAADDLDAQAGRLARAVGVRPGPDATVDVGGTRVEFMSRQRLANLYRNNVDLEGALPRVVGMSIAVRSLNAFRASLDSRWTDKLVGLDRHHLIAPAAECFGVMLEFLEPNVSLA